MVSRANVSYLEEAVGTSQSKMVQLNDPRPRSRETNNDGKTENLSNTAEPECRCTYGILCTTVCPAFSKKNCDMGKPLRDRQRSPGIRAKIQLKRTIL